MYDGELLVLGDPSVKPYDAMYIWDKMTEMFGMCEVKEVIHHLSFETGFVTSIKPDCMVSVADPNRHKLWGWAGSIAAGVVIESALYACGKCVTKIAADEAKSLAVKGQAKGVQAWNKVVRTLGTTKDEAGNVTTNLDMAEKLAQVEGWSSKASGIISSVGSIALGAGAAIVAGAPVIPFLLGVATMAVAAQSIANWIKNQADLAECVVVNFLTLHGIEFSAGVVGHKGIVVGSQTHWLKYDWMNVPLDWISKHMTIDNVETPGKFSNATVNMYNPGLQENMEDMKRMQKDFYTDLTNKFKFANDMNYAVDPNGVETYIPTASDKDVKFDMESRISWSNVPPAYHNSHPAMVNVFKKWMNMHGSKVSISSTWESANHASNSRHKVHKAVDINIIGGVQMKKVRAKLPVDYDEATLKQLKAAADYDTGIYSKMMPSGKKAWKAAVELGKSGELLELYGPWGIWKRVDGVFVDRIKELNDMLAKLGGKPNSAYDAKEAEILKLWRNHLNHIHMSV
jgi:hypothetical protein